MHQTSDISILCWFWKPFQRSKPQS